MACQFSLGSYVFTQYDHFLLNEFRDVVWFTLNICGVSVFIHHLYKSQFAFFKYLII